MMGSGLPWEVAKGSHTSFLVCDMAAHGSPVRYVSRGFQTLFGLSKTECLGSPSASWLKRPPIVAQDEQLESLGHDLGMLPHCIQRKLNFLTAYASAEHQDVVRASPSEKIGVALLLNRNAAGDLFTCEVTTFTFESPAGDVCSASVLRDITDQVSTGSLLSAAGSGEYFGLVRSRKKLVSDPLAIDRVRTSVVPALWARLGRPLGAAQQGPTTLDELPEFLPDSGLSIEARSFKVSSHRRISCNVTQPPSCSTRAGGA
mmetsp:Transcript_77247/g.213643  ORF Transcript_77247/g.213643 Transcript_77247/m.213643 type:complete len:259 (-) Transcript_77247:294-1070(-)